MGYSVLGSLLLALLSSEWLLPIKAQTQTGDDLCQKVTCEEGKGCKVVKDPETGNDIAICVIADDCGCQEEYECVHLEKKAVCVCVADECMPKGESCGDGQFWCSKYEVCVNNERCCVADCKSAFAAYVFKRPEPICGEDGVTYESLCFFNRDRCLRNDFSTYVSFDNHECQPRERQCGPTHFCSADQICAKNHRGYRCCPASCSVPIKSDYLCGNDHRVHMDACHLQRTSCILGENIEIVDKNSCKQDCKLGSKTVSSGNTVHLQDRCSKCQCNNGHWYCNREACLQ